MSNKELIKIVMEMKQFASECLDGGSAEERWHCLDCISDTNDKIKCENYDNSIVDELLKDIYKSNRVYNKKVEKLYDYLKELLEKLYKQESEETEVKKVEKWEIVKYEQEVTNRQFDWEDVEQGYTLSDMFRNHDGEIIESFENEDEARKVFQDYEMEISSWVPYNCGSLRYVTEYELQYNIYEIDDDGDEDMTYCDGWFSKIPDSIMAEKEYCEIDRYVNFEYHTLDEMDDILQQYHFYIDSKNDVNEVFEREKDEGNNATLVYKYKDTNLYLFCDVSLEDGEIDYYELKFL